MEAPTPRVRLGERLRPGVGALHTPAVATSGSARRERRVRLDSERLARKQRLVGAFLSGDGAVAPRAPRVASKFHVEQARCAPDGERLVSAGGGVEGDLACGLGEVDSKHEILQAEPGLAARVEPELGRGELLLPGFTLPIPREGEVAELMSGALQVLSRARSGLLRPSRSALRPRGGGSGTLLRALRPGVRPPPPGGDEVSVGDVEETGETYTAADDSPEDGADTVDGDAGVGAGAPVVYSAVTLGYRTVSFDVDGEWLAEYLADFAEMYDPDPVTGTTAHGLVSSIDDTLDLLWRPFMSAARGSHETFQRLIGCYNLPRTTKRRAGSLSEAEVVSPSWSAGDKPDLFWHLDWGPAQKVLLYALQLVYTYVEHLEDDRTPAPCSGLRSFAMTLLEDKEATNDAGTTCTLSVHLRNAETGYDYVNEPCVAPVLDCDDGYQMKGGAITAGRAYDAYTLYWVASTACLSGLSSADPTCDLPESGASSNAFGDSARFGVVTHPIHLHFRGAASDYLLFLARLAMDYALTGPLGFWDALALLVDASRIARYALRIVSGLSEMLVHEIGHVFAGGDHCGSGSDSNLACMEIAARQWGCKVRGLLGLPGRNLSQRNTQDGTWLATSDDWDPDAHVHVTSAATFNRWEYCDSIREGYVGQDATYCSTTCLTHLTTDEQVEEIASFVRCAGLSFGG